MSTWHFASLGLQFFRARACSQQQYLIPVSETPVKRSFPIASIRHEGGLFNFAGVHCHPFRGSEHKPRLGFSSCVATKF